MSMATFRDVTQQPGPPSFLPPFSPTLLYKIVRRLDMLFFKLELKQTRVKLLLQFYFLSAVDIICCKCRLLVFVWNWSCAVIFQMIKK